MTDFYALPAPCAYKQLYEMYRDLVADFDRSLRIRSGGRIEPSGSRPSKWQVQDVAFTHLAGLVA